MTAFMLACYMNGIVQGSIYFKSVNDCTFYQKNLSNQEFIFGSESKKYNCMCKLVPSINPDKVKVY